MFKYVFMFLCFFSKMQQMVNSDSRFTASQQPIEAALGPRTQSNMSQQSQLSTINQSQLGLGANSATHNSPSPSESKSATPSPSSSVHEDDHDDGLRVNQSHTHTHTENTHFFISREGSSVTSDLVYDSYDTESYLHCNLSMCECKDKKKYHYRLLSII